MSPVLHTVALVSERLIGHCLFSATLCELRAMEVVRVYSSHPQAYPVGGRKKKAGTSWAAHVMQDGQVLVSAGPAELASHFEDHALMASLGVRSLINVPVVVRGGCAGVLNIGLEQPQVRPDQLEWAIRLGPLAATAFTSST